MATPNDLVALSPTSFLVTNDHYYREGVMRQVEDLYRASAWSNTIYVDFSEASGHAAKADKTHGVKASVALDHMHNNNGIARGKSPNEFLVACCTSGVLQLTDYSGGKLTVRDSVLLDSTLDNPSYFADPYANATFDASAYINCGLTKGHEIMEHIRNETAEMGIMVWRSTPAVPAKGDEKKAAPGPWKTELLFEDDGSRISSISTAVVVALEPTQDGHRPARLFMTGPWSRAIVAVNIDL